MAVVTCETRVGIASAASSVAWAGGGGSRNVVDWLPRIDEPFAVIRGDKAFLTARAWNYLRELGERMGGVQGPSIPQVVATQTQVQTQVAETLNYAVQVSDYATQIASTSTATAEVASNNGLTGAGSIPPTGSPPSRPNTHVE